MIILKRFSTKGKPEDKRSYIPYEEQKRRKKKLDKETELAAAGSLGLGGGYVGLKAAAVKKREKTLKEGAHTLAEDTWRRANSNKFKRALNKVTGKNKRLERDLIRTFENIERESTRKIKKAGKTGAIIAGSGLVLTGAGRLIKDRLDKKKGYYDNPQKD